MSRELLQKRKKKQKETSKTPVIYLYKFFFQKRK